MTLEQALLRIIELQDEVVKLKEQLNQPSIVVNPGLAIEDLQLPYKIQVLDCTGGCSYPNPYWGTMPPQCVKCGRQSQAQTTVAYTAGGMSDPKSY